MEKVVDGPKAKTTVEQDYRKGFKKATIPDDFDSEEDFLRYAWELYADDLDADSANRLQAIDDMRFLVGEQWDSNVQSKRIRAKKPTLTINRLPAFVAQLIGNQRLNQTDIKVVPEDNLFKKVARIREGIIRQIQYTSRSSRAYDMAYQNAVSTGDGDFRIVTEFADDDVFEQNICIDQITNPFGVVWDRFSNDITGNDAHHCFVDGTMSSALFKKEWPDATPGGAMAREYLVGLGIDGDFYAEDDIMIVEFWRMRTRRRILALLRNSMDPEDIETSVEDVTDMDDDEFMARVVVDENGFPKMREADVRYAQMYLITPTDILEGPYELPIKRVPVFRVKGWEFSVGTSRHRWGLIRFLKDPQKLYNYWQSIIAEKLMLSPKDKWIAGKSAVEGYQKEWRSSHISDDPLLVYNDEAGQMPTRTNPAQIEPAMLQQSGAAVQDMRDISNLHQANFGQQSNEVSGKAILARQRVGEIGHAIYEENLTAAKEEAGRVINDLIPYYYDTARIVKVLGEDGKDMDPVKINDVADEESVDITVGKYGIKTVTGPSYMTKRLEASEGMLNMVNAMPETMAVVADKIVEAQDWPGSSEIARRLRSQMGLVSEEEMTPEEQQQAQQAQAQQAQAQQEQQMVFAAEMEEREARIRDLLARAAQSEANAAKAFSEVGVDAGKLVASIEQDRVSNTLSAIQTFQQAMQVPTTDINQGE